MHRTVEGHGAPRGHAVRVRRTSRRRGSARDLLRGPNDVIRAQEALHRSSTRAPDRIGEGSEVASRHHNPSRFVLAHVDDDTETLLGVLLLRHQHGPAHRECPDRRIIVLHGRLGAVPRSTRCGAFVAQATGPTRTPRAPQRPMLRNLSRASRRPLAQCSNLPTTSPTAAPIPDTTSANPVPWRSPPRHSMSPDLSDHVKPFLPAPTRLSSSIGASAHRAENSGCSSRHAFGNGCRPIRTPGRTLELQDVTRRSSCRSPR